MRKKTIILSLFCSLCLFGVSFAQANSQGAMIWFSKSALKKGDALKFEIAGTQKIYVDFGDKMIVEKILSNPETYSEITGNWLGDTLKIYAEENKQVKGFRISDSLKNLNITEWNFLEELAISNCDSGVNPDFSKLDNIIRLDLRNNGFTTFSSNAFAKAKNLLYLNLGNNKIGVFNPMSLSPCTKLDTIIISNNKLSGSLSIFGYQESIQYIDYSQNKITGMNHSKHTNLRTLIANQNTLTSLTGIVNATKLEHCDISDNKFALPNNIDLSKAISLKILNLKNNLLKDLKLAKCEELSSINISNNAFDILTIIRLQGLISANTTISYAPQATISTKMNGYEGDTIDLSQYYELRKYFGSGSDTNHAYTQYSMKKKNGTVLTLDIDYKVENGKIILLNNWENDSVYIELSNSLYPQFLDENTLKTNCLRVRPPFSLLPYAACITSAKSKGTDCSLSFTGLIANAPIQIDWGNGEISEYEVKKGPTGQTGISGKKQGDTIKIYGNPSSMSLNYATDQNFTSLSLQEGAKDLFALTLSGNQIHFLDIKAAPKLKILQCQNNKLNLKTLPILDSPQTYTYAPQAAFLMEKKRFYSKDTLDLSTMVIEGTNYIWKTSSGNPLEEGIDYLQFGDKFLFLTAQTDSIYAEISHPDFPKFVDANILKTEAIKVLGSFTLEPLAIILTTEQSLESIFGFGLTGPENNTLVQIDFGNGEIKEFEIKKGPTGQTVINGILKGDSVKIYGNILSFTLTNDQKVASMHFYEGGKDLYALNCRNNKIKSLDLSICKKLVVLQFPYNQLDLASIPVKPSTVTNFTYAPQANVGIPKHIYVDSILDLSAHAFCYDADEAQYATSFVWKNANGDTLKNGTDYSEEFGIFRFLNPIDSVYVIFNNELFPLFKDANSLRSTYLEKCEIRIEPTLAITLRTNLEIGDSLRFRYMIPTSESETHIWYDWGNGDVKEYRYSKELSKIEITAEVKGENIKIYAFTIDSLYLSKNELKEIKTEAGIGLKNIQLSENKLEKVMLSEPNSLTFMNLDSNLLEAIDLSNIPNLEKLNIAYNKLKILNIENLKKLKVLACHNNSLYFDSLPKPSSDFESYTYAPQAAQTISSASITRMYPLNMDGMGENIEIIWKNHEKRNLDLNTDYYKDENTYRFIRPFPNGIFAELSHPHFPDFSGEYAMTSQLITVHDSVYPLQNLLVEAKTELKKHMIFSLSATVSQKYAELQIDRGDGIVKTWHLIDTIHIQDTLKGDKGLLKIYGNTISKLNLENMKLAELEIKNNSCLEELNCSKNNLSELDLKDASALKKINLSINNFALNNLPEKADNWTDYIYAPQVIYSLDLIDEKHQIDLSNFYKLKGVSSKKEISQYIWLNTNEQALISGEDYTENEGVFTFLRSTKDSVYCVIGTPAFPDFNKDKAYKTASIYIHIIELESSAKKQELDFYAQHNTLHISNLTPGDLIRIMNTQGRIYVTTKIKDNRFSYSLQDGIYLIFLNNKIISKVLVK